MGRLKHRTAPGCTYFVTTKAWRSRELFQLSENAGIVIQCLLGYREKGTYRLHEFVVTPNHLHLLLTPADHISLERAMQLIRGGSSHEIHGQREHKLQIWHPGFHESTIRNAEDYEERRNYVRMNPVNPRFVGSPGDWLFGSASGRFSLDDHPSFLSSGAKAPSNAGLFVGAKAPTP